MKRILAVFYISFATIGALFAATDAFDYPFGPPDGNPRCPGSTQCAEGWQNVQGFRVNNHLGEDWNLGFASDDLGMPIYAAADGDVVYAQDVGGDGSWHGVIIILHTGNGLRVPGAASVRNVKTLYGHLDTARIHEWVSIGSHVVRGQQIGVIGPTPTGSTGPHLHFEVRTNVNIEVGPGYGSDATGWVSPSDFINANRGLSLRVVPAVHVKWSTTTNRAFQLLTAGAIEGPYSPTGGLIEGTGGEVGSFSEASGIKQFFRVQDTTVSQLSWLDGTWVGTGCQAGEQISTLRFTVRLDADAMNRVFNVYYSGGLSCTGNLSLLSYSDTQVQFYESFQKPSTCFDDIVMFTQINPTNVAYHFYSTNPAGSGGGLLVKQ